MRLITGEFQLTEILQQILLLFKFQYFSFLLHLKYVWSKIQLNFIIRRYNP